MKKSSRATFSAVQSARSKMRRPSPAAAAHPRHDAAACAARPPTRSGAPSRLALAPDQLRAGAVSLQRAGEEERSQSFADWHLFAGGIPSVAQLKALLVVPSGGAETTRAPSPRLCVAWMQSGRDVLPLHLHPRGPRHVAKAPPQGSEQDQVQCPSLPPFPVAAAVDEGFLVVHGSPVG